jgi:hypothetical protein
VGFAWTGQHCGTTRTFGNNTRQNLWAFALFSVFFSVGVGFLFWVIWFGYFGMFWVCPSAV